MLHTKCTWYYSHIYSLIVEHCVSIYTQCERPSTANCWGMKHYDCGIYRDDLINESSCSARAGA